MSDSIATIREIAEDIYTTRGVGIGDSAFYRWAACYTHWLDAWEEVGLAATEEILRDVRQSLDTMT